MMNFFLTNFERLLFTKSDDRCDKVKDFISRKIFGVNSLCLRTREELVRMAQFLDLEFSPSCGKRELKEVILKHRMIAVLQIIDEITGKTLPEYLIAHIGSFHGGTEPIMTYRITFANNAFTKYSHIIPNYQRFSGAYVYIQWFIDRELVDPEKDQYVIDEMRHMQIAYLDSIYLNIIAKARFIRQTHVQNYILGEKITETQKMRWRRIFKISRKEIDHFDTFFTFINKNILRYRGPKSIKDPIKEIYL